MRYSATSVMLPELEMGEQAALLQRLGFDGIEWRVRRESAAERAGGFRVFGAHRNDLTPDNFAQKAEEMRRVAADHGLAIAGIAAAATVADPDQVKLLVAGAAACGAPFVRIWCPAPWDGTANYPALYEQAVAAFAAALEATAGSGVRLGLETHGRTIHCSASATHRLLSQFPPDRVCVTFDAQNMVMDGYETTELALDLLGPYLGHCHVGGHRPVEKGRDETGTLQWDWPGCPMADGPYSFPRMIRKLKQMSYPHFISIEDFRDLPPEEKLREGIEYLRKVEATV
jgi:sugar phosphate isomerase/epimerase